MGGAGGWLRHPGGPGGLALLFTGAGLTVIAAALIVGVHLPKPSETVHPGIRGPRATVALETIVETLKTIAEAPPAPRNLSVTVRLDKDQWQNAAAGLRGIVESMAGKADGIAVGVKKVAETAGRISASVKGVAKNTGRIELGVRGVAHGTAYVANAMEGVSTHLNGLGREVGLLRNEVGQLTDRAQPPACDSPHCLGTVHFPHAWPSESEFSRACPDRESGTKWTTDPPDVAQAITNDLEQVIKNWKMQEMRGPIFIVGHASTDGASTYNDRLSERRAEFVKCYLGQHQSLKEPTASIEFKICPTGEKASTGSLRHPDSWYRTVQVFLNEPPGSILEDCRDG